jgi:hypothetical protein
MRALCPTNKLRVVDHDPPGLGPSPVLATKIQLKTTSRLRMRRLCKPSSDLIWRRVAGSHLTIRRNGHLQELRLSHPMVGMGASQAVRLCLKLADSGRAGLDGCQVGSVIRPCIALWQLRHFADDPAGREERKQCVIFRHTAVEPGLSLRPIIPGTQDHQRQGERAPGCSTRSRAEYRQHDAKSV